MKNLCLCKAGKHPPIDFHELTINNKSMAKISPCKYVVATKVIEVIGST